MYITQTEWVNEWGGKKNDKEKRIPKTIQFNSCNLSLQPWSDPYTTPDGIVYDILNIIPWLKKHKEDPVTGKPLKVSDLIKLNYHKNQEGNYDCPITYKVFTDYTHIVAIKTSGNVYCYEAVERLNIKPKNWKDLLTGQEFQKSDIITLQDPNDMEKRKAENFYHIKKGLFEVEVDDDPLKKITLTSTSEKIFKEIREKEAIEKKKKEDAAQELLKQGITPAPAPEKNPYRSRDAASFTSSAFTPKPVADDAPKPKTTKKKGYVTLVTSMGNLNLELHCDLAPLACENFLTLCERKYYIGTIFHRNIRHFMIQGGDPTATGKGGESIWKRPFPDEFNQSLKHDGVGVLSMANRGKNTNTSQFFIMYKSAPHLNNRHTIFGKVVGGMDVLKQMARAETDDNDKPVIDIRILDTAVYMNPFSEEEMQKDREEEEATKKKEKEKTEFGAWFSNPQSALKKPSGTTSSTTTTTSTTGAAPLIGKYVTGLPGPTSSKKRSIDFGAVTSVSKKQKTSGYGDFSAF